MFNSHETLWKWLPYEVMIFTKFHEDTTKIVDFLLVANFWVCPIFFPHILELILQFSLWFQMIWYSILCILRDAQTKWNNWNMHLFDVFLLTFMTLGCWRIFSNCWCNSIWLKVQRTVCWTIAYFLLKPYRRDKSCTDYFLTPQSQIWS